MKKLSILITAMALMAMSACNEKPAKNQENNDVNAQAPTTEQVDTNKKDAPNVKVQKAAPTADGKDHVVSEFNTKEYQVRLENLADGTFRMSLWKPGQDKSTQPDQIIETKKCVMQGDNYLMKGDDNTVYIISAKAGSEELTIRWSLARSSSG